MELIDGQCAGPVEACEIIGSARRWKRSAIQIARHQVVTGYAFLHVSSGGLTLEHEGAVEGKCGSARSAIELVGAHIVGVRPHAQVRVIVEDGGAQLEPIAIIRACWVGACRDCYALAVWVGRGEL